jgi:hypothetical protein
MLAVMSGQQCYSLAAYALCCSLVGSILHGFHAFCAAVSAAAAAAALQALAAGQAPSAVYGAEHLLRLFVKLPELLPPTGDTFCYSCDTHVKICSELGEFM